MFCWCKAWLILLKMLCLDISLCLMFCWSADTSWNFFCGNFVVFYVLFGGCLLMCSMILHLLLIFLLSLSSLYKSPSFLAEFLKFLCSLRFVCFLWFWRSAVAVIYDFLPVSAFDVFLLYVNTFDLFFLLLIHVVLDFSVLFLIRHWYWCWIPFLPDLFFK